MSVETETAYEKGQSAFYEGHEPHQNPYEPFGRDAHAFRQWIEGWNDAYDEYRESEIKREQIFRHDD